MKNLQIFRLLLIFSLFVWACSSDDDSANGLDDPGNGEEFSFDIGAEERNFGNSYVTYEVNQTGVDFYRLHILPPGATFDSSSGVFTGGSTGDYLTFDFKVDESEEFLTSGSYEVGYGAFSMTVEGYFLDDVTVDLDGPTDIPMVFVPEGSDGVVLEIDDSSFSVEVDVMAVQASGMGELNDVEIFGNYSSSYQFIELD